MITNPGEVTCYAIRLEFKMNSNEVEYEVLLGGLAVANSLRVAGVKVRMDSQVVVNQVKGGYQVKGDKLKSNLQ